MPSPLTRLSFNSRASSAHCWPGLGLRFFGLAGCFYLNGLSFVAVVISLRMVRFNKATHDVGTHAVKAHSIKDAARCGAISSPVSATCASAREFSRCCRFPPSTSLFGAPYITMIPIFARDIFHLGASGLAWMMGVAGAGAFCGALLLAYLGDFKRKGWSVLGGAFGFGVFLIAFAQATRLTWSLIFLFGVGFTVVTSVAVTNTLLQQLVTDEMRGRVMSMFILSFIGAMPIGNLLAGAASHRFSTPFALTAGGVCIIIYVTIVAFANPRLRELR